jgi:uncharacterized protein
MRVHRTRSNHKTEILFVQQPVPAYCFLSEIIQVGTAVVVRIQYPMSVNDQQHRCLPGASPQSDRQASAPRASDSEWLRYSSRPLPAYRFVPGVTPHPRRHPHGHSYGQPEPALSAPAPDQWQANEAYLYGVDLYNCAFWWECHEIFEACWRAAPKTQPGSFFQALIHVAAANLKICMGSPASADRLSLAAFERFQTLPSIYMGVDVRGFERDMRAYVAGSRKRPAFIRLLTSADKPRH